MGKVLFLDYDGVVNTLLWNEEGTETRYCYPKDCKVNNYQAVQWVSEFCEKYHYDIVVISSWRTFQNWKECLINGGLRESVNIIGATPVLDSGERSEEIRAYLNEHPEVENFIIIEDDVIRGFEDNLVKCNSFVGFGVEEFLEAIDMDEYLTGGCDEEVDG